jgi:hypothetical protein
VATKELCASYPFALSLSKGDKDGVVHKLPVPFALSLSKGDKELLISMRRPFMVRQAHHERT